VANLRPHYAAVLQANVGGEDKIIGEGKRSLELSEAEKENENKPIKQISKF
jgi:hypothetical protein